VTNSTADLDTAREWVRRVAHRIETHDPQDELSDLRGLDPLLARAAVVGLGESVRGVRSGREFYRLKHRVVRLAVEHHGFTTVALEERDADVVPPLDRYVCDGVGDLSELVARLWSPWQTLEFFDLMSWIRAHNAARGATPVRIIAAVSDRPYGLAEHTLAWRSRTGAKTVYWGGMAHTAAGDIAASPPTPHPRPAPADGASMRRSLGDAYVSIGLTCNHAIEQAPMPPPPANFAESVFPTTEPCYVTLRHAAAGAARGWLHRPTRTRIIGPRYDPDHDADYYLACSSIADCFDVMIHVPAITPTRPI
jgi:erythromycin esterase